MQHLRGASQLRSSAMHSPDPDDTCECGETTLLGCTDRPARKCPAMNGRYRMEKPRMLDITSFENTETNTKKISVKRLPHSDGLDLPSYATEKAAGMDLYAAIGSPVTLLPGGRAVIPTGLKIALPTSTELQVRSRSGLALKNGIVVANSPGTIDEDFRGEIGVILLNTSPEPFTVERGMRIAQAVLVPVLRAEWEEVYSLDETSRGEGAYGSTGR